VLGSRCHAIRKSYNYGKVIACLITLTRSKLQNEGKTCWNLWVMFWCNSLMFPLGSNQNKVQTSDSLTLETGFLPACRANAQKPLERMRSIGRVAVSGILAIVCCITGFTGADKLHDWCKKEATTSNRNERKGLFVYIFAIADLTVLNGPHTSALC
jgi:hypothetical protein